MTTTLPYNRRPTPIEELISFDPDPGPLPDAMQQDLPLQEFLHILSDRFTNFGRVPDIFLSSNTFICYDPNDLNVRVSPDCYIAFGVDAAAIRRRRLYLPWEAGKAPDFVLEVASESTGRQDTLEKRALYARIGIGEYWRFDPTGGDYHGDAMGGDVLIGGEYRPLELSTEPDGVLKGYSPVLDLSLSWDNGRLIFYDTPTGMYLANLGDERAAHEETRARLRLLEERLSRLQSEE